MLMDWGLGGEKIRRRTVPKYDLWGVWSGASGAQTRDQTVYLEAVFVIEVRTVRSSATVCL